MKPEIDDREIEKPEKALSNTERQTVISQVKGWLDGFPKKEKRLEEEDPRWKEEKDWEAEVADLDKNTAPDLKETVRPEKEEDALTREELEQLDESDPGYVNGDVLDYDNELGTPDNHYRETGSHAGAIRWGEYAKDDKEYVAMKPGTVLSRFGGEEGRFLADPETSYEDLQLPVISQKNTRFLYEVVKEFPAEASQVARQPWNQTDGNPAVQYVTPVSIRELVEGGYLKKLENRERPDKKE